MVLKLVAAIPLIAMVLFLIPRLITEVYGRKYLFREIEHAPKRRVAIVLGAGLWRDGSPTPVLRDRVTTAARLYFEGKVEKLLFSGDNSVIEYNEPGAMRAFALQLGVPDEAIVLDYAGRRTYDTCYRARAIFGVQDAIVVTQGFHLPRAVYLCRQMGIDAVGVSADLRVYRRFSLLYWNLRETLATLNALWEVHVSRPTPILGKTEPIFPLEAQ